MLLPRLAYASRIFAYWCSLIAIIITFYMTSVFIVYVFENKQPEVNFSDLNQEGKFGVVNNGSSMAMAGKFSYYYPSSLSKLPRPQKPSNIVKKPNISPPYESSLAKPELKRISNSEHSDMGNYIQLLNTLIGTKDTSLNLGRSYMNHDPEYDPPPRPDDIDVNKLGDLLGNENQFGVHEDDNQKSFNYRLGLNRKSFKSIEDHMFPQASKTRIPASPIKFMSSTINPEALIDRHQSLENLIQRFSVLAKFSRLLEILKHYSEENVSHISPKSNKLDKATTIDNRTKLKNTVKLSIPLWPEDSNTSDRIMEQLSLTPEMLNFKSSSKRSCHPDNIFPDFFHNTQNNSSYNAEKVLQRIFGGTHKKLPTKVIYVATHLHPTWNDIPYGCGALKKSKCAFTNCYLTDSADPTGIPRRKAHAVLYRNAFPTESDMDLERNPAQLWIFHSLESPMNMNTGYFGRLYSWFNLTATYRPDSDIVTPYDKYITSPYSRSREPKESRIQVQRVNVPLTLNRTVKKYLNLTIALKSHLKSHDTLLDDEIVNRLLIHSYHPMTPEISSLNLSHLYDNLNALLVNLRALSFPPPKYSLPPSLILYLKNEVTIKTGTKNYAIGKTKMIAWFVSNCESQFRLDYANTLNKYIPVDIYGKCGDSPLYCAKEEGTKCFDMLDKDYKFYLSFENSRCKGYVTEKFFDNGLKNTIIPIVMGPSKSEYIRIAPSQSFIHVDDFPSPAHLALYLYILDSDDQLYNSYLAWKSEGGTFVDTKFWCRICAMINYSHLNFGSSDINEETRFYKDFSGWWEGDGICKPSHT
ncbi:unnamed protein product [Gordionus sp. m RMFG-2023]|uniref:uncharacterized protein LOC135925451 n=1 Tax=Gordionus sp. m RMFG-2023 TaxID=3053472 RepID=UPI0030E23356